MGGGKGGREGGREGGMEGETDIRRDRATKRWRETDQYSTVKYSTVE